MALTGGSGGRRGRVVLVIALALVGIMAGLAAVAVIPRHDEVPTDVDAVIALGGSPDRVELARRIAEDRDAALVLSAGSIRYGEEAGLACTDDDILCLHPEPSTTAGEARGAAALADEHDWQVVVAATDTWHANRSRLLLRQCLDDVAVVGVDDRQGFEASRRTLHELAGMAAGLTVERAC